MENKYKYIFICLTLGMITISGCNKAIDDWVEKEKTKIINEGFSKSSNLKSKINNAGGVNPFLEKSIKNDNYSDVEYALEYGANPNGYYNSGVPLMTAVLNSNKSLIKLLIDNGADINLKVDGMSPIISTVFDNDLGIMKLLIDNNADLNDNMDGMNLLSLAIMGNNPQLLDYLLKSGAEINYYRDNGIAYVGMASHLKDVLNQDNSEILKTLKKYGVN